VEDLEANLTEDPATGEPTGDAPNPGKAARKRGKQARTRKSASAGPAEDAETSEDAETPEEGGVEDAQPEAAEEEEAQLKRGPGADLPPEELRRRVSALLFASPDPLSMGRLCKLLDGPEPAQVRAAIADIQARLEAADLSLEVRGLAGGHLYMTTPSVAPVIQKLSKIQANERVSPASLETLAVVAYRQPVTKAEVEAIRGVQAGPILRSLVDRGLVRVTGRADVPGHPLQYGTTKEFLDRFGLMSLKDLPRDGELARD